MNPLKRCGHLMDSTIRHNIKNFYFLPTECVYMLCMHFRINSDYFHIFPNQTECVRCALRAESLNTVQLRLQGVHSTSVPLLLVWEQNVPFSLSTHI